MILCSGSSSHFLSYKPFEFYFDYFLVMIPSSVLQDNEVLGLYSVNHIAGNERFGFGRPKTF